VLTQQETMADDGLGDPDAGYDYEQLAAEMFGGGGGGDDEGEPPGLLAAASGAASGAALALLGRWRWRWRRGSHPSCAA
jgi:hypothetical protein